MSLDLRKRLFAELDRLVLIDPHTHINALDPASHTLADILGYHYYTELAHSAGMTKDQIEEPGLDPKEKVRRLIENLGPIQNTIQYSWLVEMCQTFFGLHDADVTPANWEKLYDSAERLMCHADWPQQVLERSKLEAVFLTNDFDDPLEGFDTKVYIPCLRTDDLVFHLAKPEVRGRLEKATCIAPVDARNLRRAIAALFTHFKLRGARACAISLPPDFAPMKVSLARANTALAAIHADGVGAAESHRRAIGNYVFWTLAEMCDLFKLPFDLMIGVNRGVYEAGVYQGRDLYDSRVSLVQYKELFNAFRRVTFPISVLASVTNQELTSYAWIFPNVTTNGHWWYSNTPAFIEHDLAARLEAVPRTKQIGYYSDMYKLEFALPKFAMFKRILAKVLAERFVIDRGWSEEQAVALGRQVLRGNVESIFRWDQDLTGEMPGLSSLEPINTTVPLSPISTAAALAAQRNFTPVPGESEILDRLPERPVKEFVIPVPPDREDSALSLQGESAAAQSRQPPELEVVQEPAEASERQPGSLPPVAVEPVEEVGEVNEALRRTEPFPSKPPAKEP
jgi:glucuronate isomerase